MTDRRGPAGSGTASPSQCGHACWRSLEAPELSPREPAVRFTDREKYFVSEASVYRLLKAHDLITSPAFIVVKAAEAFTEKTTAPNQLWQTDFTYLKVIGWGWFYLSTILDDYSRFIVAWKLCTTMRAGDVTDTLELALAKSTPSFPSVRSLPRAFASGRWFMRRRRSSMSPLRPRISRWSGRRSTAGSTLPSRFVTTATPPS